MMFKRASFIVLLTGSMYAGAEPLTGEAELGFVQTGGNTETSNINAKLFLIKEDKNWKYEGKLTGLGSSSEDPETGEDNTTAEKYTAELKADRKLDERSFLYGLSTYEDDRFSGFDYQVTAGLGYGFKAIADDTRTLTLEVGPGYRYNAVEGADDEGEVTIRLGEKFDWKFSETAELNQYVIAEGGEDNTITRAGIAIKSTLIGMLALKVGMDFKYTEEVPSGSDHTDTETYATVVYKF